MQQHNIQKLLPAILQRTLREGSVLQALLGVMEQLHQPTEDLLAKLHQTFNPQTAPDELLPMLAHWMDLLRLFQPPKAGAEPALWANRTLPTDEQNMRALIASATRLSQWRGTHYGMLQTLRIATGLEGFSIDDGTLTNSTNPALPFHIYVTAPADAEPYKELIERIVIQEKPAYTTFTLIMPKAVIADVEVEPSN